MLLLALLLVVPAVAVAVRFKAGVDLSLAPEMTRALPWIDRAHDDVGIERGAIITSGRRPGSTGLHPEGKAVDLRTKDLADAQKTKLVDALRHRLNGSLRANRPYQVIFESRIEQDGALVREEHIHIEYQPVAA